MTYRDCPCRLKNLRYNLVYGDFVQHGGTSAPGDLFVTHEQGLNILEEAAKAIADSPAVERAMAGSKAIIKSGD